MNLPQFWHIWKYQKKIYPENSFKNQLVNKAIFIVLIDQMFLQKNLQPWTIIIFYTVKVEHNWQTSFG
jgi:hypothetical protein